jgi:hypothetical protein
VGKAEQTSGLYDWIQGRPPMLLHTGEVDRWPGGSVATRRLPQFAAIGDFEGSHVLVLRDPEATTVVPLELGGLLFVSAVYCDDEGSLGDHLDMMPVSGWELLPKRFRSRGGSYALFDASLSGHELRDPAQRRRVLEEHGGMLQVNIPPGTYDVECFGPWNPDARTSLWLTRLIRAAPADAEE